jgi:hypothetical protein
MYNTNASSIYADNFNVITKPGRKPKKAKTRREANCFSEMFIFSRAKE